jgi:hypothetical protein
MIPYLGQLAALMLVNDSRLVLLLLRLLLLFLLQRRTTYSEAQKYVIFTKEITMQDLSDNLFWCAMLSLLDLLIHVSSRTNKK